MGDERLNEFLTESKARQRNIVFPDTVRNARSVDAFLWRGSANPTWVQTIGAWLFAFGYFWVGMELGYLAVLSFRKDDRFGVCAMGVLFLGSLAVALRIFRNGFRHRNSKYSTTGSSGSVPRSD
jgi:hypothetical protein